jgi:MerR family glutamine synthetase transcriptional repressor
VPHADGLYTLGEVRALTGLTDRRIRYYEQLGLLEPMRSPGHQRLFSQDDVDRLRAIKRLLDGGMSLRDVRRYFREHHPEPDEALEAGDASHHFRGIEWVRHGQVAEASPLSRHPDILRRWEQDEE